MNDSRAQVLAYHQATKHHFHAYAHGPGYMDWATQPNPFRRYRGAPSIELEKVPPGDHPLLEGAAHPGQVQIAPLNYPAWPYLPGNRPVT
jgi:hypothetical protein